MWGPHPEELKMINQFEFLSLIDLTSYYTYLDKVGIVSPHYMTILIT